MDKKIYEEVRQEFAITSANEYFGIIKNDLKNEVNQYLLLINIMEELYDEAYREGCLGCKDSIEDFLDSQKFQLDRITNL